MICCLVSDPSGPAVAGALEAFARACSPRVEPYGAAVVVFDASGLRRVIGTPAEIGRDVSRLAVDRGMTLRIALAETTTTAWLLAHARAGITVVAPNETAAALSEMPIRWLATLPDHWIFGSGAGPGTPQFKVRTSKLGSARNYRMAPGPPDLASKFEVRSVKFPLLDVLATFERWGLQTLGEIARLPRAEVHARLGGPGVHLHQAASGEDLKPLVPAGEARRFVERMVLEWPIEGLEPLSFVLARLCDALSGSLERADRGAVEVFTRLQLVTREIHERVLHLPAPMRDARVLRTLITLDLESHPPAAGIDVVEVELEVAPGRIAQGSLLTRTLPTPETLSTLTARLGALMGESRIGAPVLLDTHDDRAISMKVFNPTSGTRHLALGTRGSPVPSAECPVPDPDLQEKECRAALRRFRVPVVVRVTVDRGVPTHVAAASEIAAGAVVSCAGPWRTSGRWWATDRSDWDRDEWDVELTGGACYRLARNRGTGQWEMEGEID